MVRKKFQSHSNLLTFDNLNQILKYFTLKLILRQLYLFRIKADFGNFKPTLTKQAPQKCILQEYLMFPGHPKGTQGATRQGKSFLGVKGTNNIEPINHDRPKLTKISCF